MDLVNLKVDLSKIELVGRVGKISVDERSEKGRLSSDILFYKLDQKRRTDDIKKRSSCCETVFCR